jgi:hypothetical protein
MSLKGSAFLALWNDIEPARDGEYNLWHTREHVPERLSVPGVLSGRRYVGRDAAVHRYFTLYELDSLAVLASQPYKALVDGPTPWSRSMRPSFRNFLRYPCTTALSLGRGTGGALATLRFGEASPPPAAIERLFDIEAVTGLHLGVADLSQPFPLQTAPAEQDPRHVLIVEATDRQRLEEAMPAIAATIGSAAALVYDLAYAITREELAGPAAPFTPPNR